MATSYSYNRPVARFTSSRNAGGVINVSGGVSFEFQTLDKDNQKVYKPLDTSLFNKIFTQDPCLTQKYTKFPVGQANQFLESLKTHSNQVKQYFPLKIKFTHKKTRYSDLYDTPDQLGAVAKFETTKRQTSPITTARQALSARESVHRGNAIAELQGGKYLGQPVRYVSKTAALGSRSGKADPQDEKNIEFTRDVDALLKTAKYAQYGEIQELRANLKKYEQAYKSNLAAGLNTTDIETQLRTLIGKLNTILAATPNKTERVTKPSTNKRLHTLGTGVEYALDDKGISPRNLSASGSRGRGATSVVTPFG
jgi:hypothetical protein